MISNCLFFSVGRYLTKGGYIVIRRSDYGWWPHCLWSPDLVTFEQFHPVVHRRWYGWALRWHVPLLLFDGEAKPWVNRTVLEAHARRLRREQFDDRIRGIVIPENEPPTRIPPRSPDSGNPGREFL